MNCVNDTRADKKLRVGLVRQVSIVYRVNGFDGLASDYISLNRSLKDLRHPGCLAKKYIPKLPSITVIFPFHNEVHSTLLLLLLVLAV